jgi:GPH family glycoside/pentoside/hexuronide:cation symporter
VALIAAGPMIDLLGFQKMAVIMAALALGSRYLALGGIWRHIRRDVPPVTFGLVSAYRATFRNRQFLAFLPTFILFNMGITLMTAALPFFVEEILQPPENRVGTYSSVLAAMPIAVLLLSLPLVQRLAVRWGKARVYALSMLFGACYFPLLFFMGFLPGVPPLLQGIIFIAPAGLAMAGVFVFPNALMADIIDYDEMGTGMRREGIYYAAQNFVEGVTVAMHSLILAGLLLLGGTAEHPLGIRLVGPIVGVSILVGYLIFRSYRLPDIVTHDTTSPTVSRMQTG